LGMEQFRMEQLLELEHWLGLELLVWTKLGMGME
jgi:hypothetical protein